jgi:leucyl-tRNA synthetase
MFPYPSGAGLHVGHPLGYIGTDSYGRYQRMAGRNVLHAMGFDAFGLPAEQYAVQTGKHPRLTTEDNVRRYRAQLRRLGLAYDARRSVATTDVAFYRWTQWIFLQIFNSWYDPEPAQGPPIAELVKLYEKKKRSTPDGRPWAKLSEVERRRIVDDHRLAYVSEAPVNWCPGLGTVLANEEVTADGRSDRGNFPVFKRSLKQWMMRITAYGEPADRRPGCPGLAGVGQADAASLDRPLHRRAHRLPVLRTIRGGAIRVFTTRPDTVYGATYMVVAPEHEVVDGLVPTAWPKGAKKKWTGGHKTPAAAVAAYREFAARETDAERTAESREKTGVFTGAYATNPGQRRADPDLHRRLRAGRLRHRGHHGGARAGRAGLGVRRGLRPADRAHGPAHGGLRRQGVPG